MPAPEPPPRNTEKAPPRTPASDTFGSGSAGLGTTGGPPRDPRAGDARAGDPEPGFRIGRYQVIELLGEGGFGRVYRAFDPNAVREVAIKLPRPEGLTPQIREAVFREARAAAAIDHPNVCPIYDVETNPADECPYIVMRFVPTGTLAGQRTPVPPRAAAAIARRVALGVAAGHARGVVHRDLKPGNVLWDEANNDVFVTDFGLARVPGTTTLNPNNQALGTPGYMAPEQARGEAVGPPADVFALGVILYELITGVRPFPAGWPAYLYQVTQDQPRPPSAARPGLDPRLDALCLKALEKNPADRFPTAREFAAAVTDFLRRTGGVEDADPPPPPAPPPPPLSPPPLSPPPQSPPALELPGEQVVCPRCRARLEVRVDRTAPVKCPLCDCRFSVDIGRKTAARTVRPTPDVRPRLEPPKPLPVAQRAGRGPTARGLSAAWVGGLLAVVCVVAGAGVAIAQWEGPHPRLPTRTDPPSYLLSLAALSAGAAVSLLVVGAGRRRAGARLAGALTLLGVLAVAGGGAVVSWDAWQDEARKVPDWASAGRVAAAAGVGLLLLAELAFHRYLARLARAVADFPDGLASLASALGLLTGVPAAAAGACVAARWVLNGQGVATYDTPLGIGAGLAATGAAVVAPFALAASAVLTGRAAAAAARPARYG